MNLLEAKKLLENKGYKLIREDAYMDAMDQELDDIQRQNAQSRSARKIPVSRDFKEIDLKLTYTCPDNVPLDEYVKRFADGNVSKASQKALGRLSDLCIHGESVKEIENLKNGDTITFDRIPAWYGNFSMTSERFKSYLRHYGDEVMRKMIGLSCTKENAEKLKALTFPN